jgi:hypothetical protein
METAIKIFESVINLLFYIGSGFIGFLVLLFFLALIFGKRVKKKWEFEANFYNDNKKEIGEFDIEMKKYAKEEGDFRLDAKFRLKHPELKPGRVVQVFLDDILVMEGVVKKEGRIILGNEYLKHEIKDAETGQMCRVTCSSIELFSEPLQKD